MVGICLSLEIRLFMLKYIIAISIILLSCAKSKTDKYTFDFFYENYKDYFIGDCFYFYLDDKKYKERFECADFLYLSDKEKFYLDSMVASLRFDLNAHIANKSEGGYSMYLYGKNGKNILEDSLKGRSVSTALPGYFCVAKTCMNVVRSKDFQDRAKKFAKRRAREEKEKNK